MAGPAHAGLVSRVAALAVDVIVLTLAGLAVTQLPILAWEQVVGTPPGWLTAGSAAVGALLPWAYFTTCWWLTGRTIGNGVIGVEVRTRAGQELSFVRAAARAAVGLLLAPLWLLGLVAILLRDDRRALHDLVFGTAMYYQTVVQTHHGAL